MRIWHSEQRCGQRRCLERLAKRRGPQPNARPRRRRKLPKSVGVEGQVALSLASGRAGDAALRAFAEICRSALRSTCALTANLRLFKRVESVC